ncbi:MAG: type II toxin-antitoxin system mRNA interferase toxin, RelE/StbE family [Isosphaeraceae bacterium]
MNRRLIQTGSFIRAAKRLTKKHPDFVDELHSVLVMLGEDAFHPNLKTHKLKGDLEGSWACSAGYDMRIIFAIIPHEGSEAILLKTMGTHDEVY